MTTSKTFKTISYALLGAVAITGVAAGDVSACSSNDRNCGGGNDHGRDKGDSNINKNQQGQSQGQHQGQSQGQGQSQTTTVKPVQTTDVDVNNHNKVDVDTTDINVNKPVATGGTGIGIGEGGAGGAGGAGGHGGAGGSASSSSSSASNSSAYNGDQTMNYKSEAWASAPAPIANAGSLASVGTVDPCVRVDQKTGWAIGLGLGDGKNTGGLSIATPGTFEQKPDLNCMDIKKEMSAHTDNATVAVARANAGGSIGTAFVAKSTTTCEQSMVTMGINAGYGPNSVEMKTLLEQCVKQTMGATVKFDAPPHVAKTTITAKKTKKKEPTSCEKDLTDCRKEVNALKARLSAPAN